MSRTDVDVLFVGGPLNNLEIEIEKVVSTRPSGLLVAAPPEAIPVGHMMLGGMVSVSYPGPMIGHPPVIGVYIPAGISDNGRRVYWWGDA